MQAIAESPHIIFVNPDESMIELRISGDVVASGLSFEAFLDHDEWQHVEWVNGWVIEMASIGFEHSQLTDFVKVFFKLHFEAVNEDGLVTGDPMVMRLVTSPSGRAPDVLVLREERRSLMRANYVDGPADIVVEVLSPGTGYRRDEIEKYLEYERAGIPEYWIFDPLKRTARFLQRGVDGFYEEILPVDGLYMSRTLPGLRFPLEWLSREKLPTIAETTAFMQAIEGNAE